MLAALYLTAGVLKTTQPMGKLNALTGVAATGLALIQVGAMVFHVRRGETNVLPMNLALLVTAAFVAVVRFVWL